jgi:hypothetical protein
MQAAEHLCGRRKASSVAVCLSISQRHISHQLSDDHCQGQTLVPVFLPCWMADTTERELQRRHIGPAGRPFSEVPIRSLQHDDTLRASLCFVLPTMLTVYKAQWSLHLALSSTVSNCTFCPHSVFMCFVWIWEQTSIISLYSINWLVFITEIQCAVRTEYLAIIQDKQFMFYIVILSIIKWIKCIMRCASFHSSSKRPYRTPITFTLRKIKLSGTIDKTLEFVSSF